MVVRPRVSLLRAALLFLVPIIFLIASATGRGIVSRGEGREASVVSAMFEQHNFILPLRNSFSIPSKPPFFHWMAAVSSVVTGQLDEVALRLPSIIASAATVLLLYCWLTPLIGSLTSSITCLILLTSFEWIRNSVHARVDMVFAFFITASALGLVSLLRNWRINRATSPLLSGVLVITLSSGVLTKGPAGLVLPFVVAILFEIVRTPRKHWLTSIGTIYWSRVTTIIMCALVFSAIWYLLAYYQHGNAFLHKQVLQENIARVFGVTGTNVGHQKPIYSVIPLSLLGFMPWSLMLPVVYILLKSRRSVLSETERELVVLSLVWLGVFLVAIACSTSKRVVYLLPAYPALAILCAVGFSKSGGISLAHMRSYRFSSFIVSGVLALLAVVMMVVAIVMLSVSKISALVPSYLSIDSWYLDFLYAELQSNSWIYLWVSIVFGLALWCIRTIRQNRMKMSFALLLCVLFSSMTLVYHFILPAYSSLASSSKFVEIVRASVKQNTPLYQFNHELYPIVFYLRRPIVFTSSLHELGGHKESFVIVRSDEVEQAKSLFQTYKLNAQLVTTSMTRAFYGKDTLTLFRVHSQVG